MISIAIDGPSGAGKSTLAKKIAKKYGFVYVDTGAIYRTVGLYCLNNGIKCKDEDAIKQEFNNINIDIKYNDDGLQTMYLNGTDVSNKIREPSVSIAASDVSSLPAVRQFLLDMQRKFAKNYNVILDGRDIGTVVLPNADCKIFLTASSSVRAERRMKELSEKGIYQDYNDVLKDIEYRDYQDTHREVAPLKQASDAVLLDTSELSFVDSFNELCTIIESKVSINI